MTTNLILGFCTGYRFELIESFIASALSAGNGTQLCLFTDGLDETFYKVAARRGILVEDAAPYLRMGFHPQNSRYFAYRQFLNEHSAKFSNVLLTDVRDVFFQGDPFAIPYPLDVCIALEDTRIKWETINQAWIRDLYGDTLLDAIADNHVACSGTTLGRTAGILAYIEILCRELETRDYNRMQVYDQGIHNYITWKIRPAWAWIDTTDAIMNSVGCTGAERIQIVDDLVVIDGKVSPVVHQWDRHEHLRQHVQSNRRFRISS